MKVQDPTVSSLAQTEALKNTSSAAASKVTTDQAAGGDQDSKVQEAKVRESQLDKTSRTGSGAGVQENAPLDGASRDDVHLSELVRSLRSLASDSPERAQRLEQIARAYAEGSYKVDAQRTAQGIIDDAIRSK